MCFALQPWVPDAVKLWLRHAVAMWSQSGQKEVPKHFASKLGVTRHGGKHTKMSSPQQCGTPRQAGQARQARQARHGSEANTSLVASVRSPHHPSRNATKSATGNGKQLHTEFIKRKVAFARYAKQTRGQNQSTSRTILSSMMAYGTPIRRSCQYLIVILRDASN